MLWLQSEGDCHMYEEEGEGAFTHLLSVNTGRKKARETSP